MFCCCFYISCSVTAQQSLPNVVRLTQQCICVHKTVSVCERGRAYSKCHCPVFLKHLLSVCNSLPPISTMKWCVLYICARLHVCAQLTEGVVWLLMEAECCCYRHAQAEDGRVCWIKKQIDCMMQNYTDSMTYTWASFMHGATADGTVLKHGLKPARSIFYNS